MSNRQCQIVPAGASWHTSAGRSEEKVKLSPRSDVTKFLAPQSLSAPRKNPAKSMVAKAGNLKGRVRKSTNPVRRRTWRDITAGDAADYGYKAWVLAKKMATLINVEEKVHDVDGSGGINVNSTPTVINLSNIAQGTDYFNRVGDSILVQSFELRLTAVGETNAEAQKMRVLLVADKEQNGTDPTLGEVLQGGTSPLIQPYNVFYEQRFNVLYDELVTMNNRVGLATGGTSTAFLGERVDMPDLVRKWNKHIKYDASAAADASNRENALYLMCVSNSASTGPGLQYTFRLRFTDN